MKKNKYRLTAFFLLLIVLISFTACESDIINNEVEYPQPLSLEELSLDFLDSDITVSQLERERKYIKREVSEDEMYVYYTMENYKYAFTTDERHWESSLAHQLVYVEIFGDKDGELMGPREIQIGDDFEGIMKKFPQEKNWREAYEFYGEHDYDNPSESEVGSVNENSNGSVDFITLVPKGHPPFIKIHFKDNVVDRMIIYYSVD